MVLGILLLLWCLPVRIDLMVLAWSVLRLGLRADANQHFGDAADLAPNALDHTVGEFVRLRRWRQRVHCDVQVYAHGPGCAPGPNPMDSTHARHTAGCC